MALFMSGIALDLPENEREQALSGVLQSLGYRVRNPAPKVHVYVSPAGFIDRSTTAKTRRTPRRYEQADSEASTTPLRSTAEKRLGEHSCGPDRGTVRGYNRHISSYHRPCPDCARARQDQLNARWDSLGIKPEARAGVKLE